MKTKFKIVNFCLLAIVFAFANCKGKTETKTDKAVTETNTLGKTLYDKNCALCHGMTGLGDTPTGKAAKARNFTGEFAFGSDLKSVIKTITNGSPKNPTMVAWKAILKPNEIEAIAKYVRVLGKKQ